MFRFPRTNSLIVHTSIVLFLSSVVLLSSTAYVVHHAFERAIERALTNQLNAFNDMLIAATRVDGQKVTLRNVSALETLPRYWQVTSNGTPIAKSRTLSDYLPISADTQHALLWKDGNVAFYGSVKTIVFPNDVNITYLFGIPKEIADRFLVSEEEAFIRTLLVSLLLLLAGLVGISYMVLRGSYTPLDALKTSITEVIEGKKTRLEGNFPKELAPLVKETNALLAYNEGLMDRYKTFSNNLSHSLKTPLSIIKNAVAGNESENAVLIRNKTTVMLGIIERNLARVRATGSGNILHSRTPVFPVIRKICEGFSRLYDKRYYYEETPTIFVGDETDLYEMLGNIIENAFKYSQSEIAVSVTYAESFLLITVEDDGKGVPDAQLDQLFKRSRRLDESIDGTGLGLSIAKDIAHLYNGELFAGKSSLGGLSVTLRLPAAV